MSTRLFALVLGLLVVAMPPFAAHAQETAAPPAEESIVPDRPDFTDGTQVVSRLQVEAGATLSRTGSEREIAIGELLFRVPVVSRMELRLFAPSHVRVRDHGDSASGWSDAAVGVKVGLTDGDPASKAIPATAFLLTTTVPIGSDELSDDDYQPEAKLALEWAPTEAIGIGVNAGYARPSDGGQRFDQLFATLSAGFTLSEKTGAFAEIYGFNKADSSGSSAMYADTGIAYLVNPNLSLDARVGFGLGNDVDGSEYFVGFGVSRRF